MSDDDGEDGEVVVIHQAQIGDGAECDHRWETFEAGRGVTPCCGIPQRVARVCSLCRRHEEVR